MATQKKSFSKVGRMLQTSPRQTDPGLHFGENFHWQLGRRQGLSRRTDSLAHRLFSQVPFRCLAVPQPLLEPYRDLGSQGQVNLSGQFPAFEEVVQPPPFHSISLEGGVRGVVKPRRPQPHTLGKVALREKNGPILVQPKKQGADLVRHHVEMAEADGSCKGFA